MLASHTNNLVPLALAYTGIPVWHTRWNSIIRDEGRQRVYVLQITQILFFKKKGIDRFTDNLHRVIYFIVFHKSHY